MNSEVPEDVTVQGNMLKNKLLQPNQAKFALTLLYEAIC